MPCVWCCVCRVLGRLAPVHRCAGSVCGVVCTVSRASWLLFTGVHALCVVLRVRCPGPHGFCSLVCTLCVWCCLYGVQGLLALVHRCARSVCGVSCTASWASWLLFTGVHTLCVVLRVRLPGPPGSCSPVCTLCVWCCVYTSRASWLLFTGLHALCVVLRVRRPGPPDSCSPVCTLCAWCCVYGVLGLLAPVHQCARSVCRVACTASWASWLLFTGVYALCMVLRVRCPGPPGSCSPLCTLCVWCCLYGVLGLLAPVHRCARSVSGVVCTVSWASWLPFTGVHALCVVLRVRCPWPPGSCSPMCTLCVWCCVYGVLGLLAPVHRCARSVCGVACTVSWASWLLFTGAHALCVVLCARCPGPLGSWSPVCLLRCVVSCARRPGPLGPSPPVCTLCVWCCVHGVLGLLAPVHRCARSVFGVACTVSLASWLLFTGVHALCVVLRVRCPGPPGSCSPMCMLCVCCCLYGVLGLLAPVHRCACSVCGVLCLVTWAPWLLVTGAPLLCVAWCVRCLGPLGSRSPVCPRGVCCVACLVSWAPWLPFTGVLSARSVCWVLCALSWATWLLFTGVRARCVAWCV